MKKFVKNITLIILPFAFIMVITNLLVDPANIFTLGTYEKKAAAVILNGHNIDNVSNCDERILIQHLIPQLKFKPDVIVVGSSRSLEISSDFFPKKSMFNISVSHANINDIISLIGLLDSSNKLPKEIYIETSCIFANKGSNNEWFSLLPYYKYGIEKMNLNITVNSIKNSWRSYTKKIKALFSFEYFQQSFRSIYLFSSPKKMIDVGLKQPKNLGRLIDGSITYPLSYRTPDTIKAMSDALLFMYQNKLPKIDDKNIQIFDKIVVYLSKKGIKVNLLNLPFQPDCYKYYSNTNQVFDEINKGIINFAVVNNVRVLGTFNPFEAKLSRLQFYDQLHCNKQALKTVMGIVKYTAIDSAK